PDRDAGILGFSGRGALKGWLRVVAVRTARRMFPSPAHDARELDESRWLGVADDPELGTIKHADREEFRRPFALATAALDARARAILALSVYDGLGPEDIARIYRVHRTTIVRWLARIFASIRERVREHVVRELAVDHTQYLSIVRLISSRLELSIDPASRA